MDHQEYFRNSNRLLSSRRLDKISSSHHRNHRCFVDILHSSALADAENRLQMSCGSARGPHLYDFIIQLLPFMVQYKRSIDHNVDFRGTVFDCKSNFLQSRLQWIEAGRKSGRYGSDLNVFNHVEFCKGIVRVFDFGRIDADGSDVKLL